MNGPDVPSSGTPPTGGDPGYDAVIEDILAGRLGHEPEDEMSLVGLVDALRAPGSDEELGDVEAATSAFLAARSGAGAEAGSGVVVPLAPRRAGRAVVAVAAVLGAVVLVGGTAAAATGSLPRPLQDAVHRIIPAFPSADEAAAKAQAEQLSTSTSESGSSSTAANRPSNGTTGTQPGSSADPGASAGGPSLTLTSAQITGLCRAFADKPAWQAADAASRKALEKLAAAQNQTVPRFCATYLAAAPGKGTPAAGNGNGNGNGNGQGNSNGNQSPGTKPSNANGNNGNGATNAHTPTKPSQATSRPSNSNKPASPGSQGNGNGKPSTTP